MEIDHIEALRTGMSVLYKIATLDDPNMAIGLGARIQAAEAMARLALEWNDNILLVNDGVRIPIDNAPQP